MVDKDDLRPRFRACPRQQNAAGIVARQPDRLGVYAGTRAAVDQRVGAIGFNSMALTEDHLSAAVAVQVRDRNVAGTMAVKGCAARLVKPLPVPPVDPGAFSLFKRLAAGQHKVIVAVPVHIPYRHRHRPHAIQYQR